jgi:hypothetical protein
MLQRVRSMIRRINGGSGFEAYLASLQRHDVTGAPTREQARREYQARLRGRG